MSIFDIIILIVLIFGFIKGIYKGFILELSGFVGIIISIYIARCYSTPVTHLLESLFGINQEMSPVIGFLVTFLAALLLFHFVAVLVDKLVRLILLGWLNKILGGVLSFLKYVLVISVFINIFNYANDYLGLMSEEKKKASKLYLPMQKVVPTVLPFLHLDDLLQYLPEDEGEYPVEVA